MTVQQLVAYHTIITIFRIRKKEEPEYLASYLCRDNIYGNIIVKTSDKDYYRNSFIYRGSTLWNKVPKILRKEVKIGTFKKKLKSWVMQTIPRFSSWSSLSSPYLRFPPPSYQGGFHLRNLQYNIVMQRLLKKVVYYLYVLCLINQCGYSVDI